MRRFLNCSCKSIFKDVLKLGVDKFTDLHRVNQKFSLFVYFIIFSIDLKLHTFFFFIINKHNPHKQTDTVHHIFTYAP